MSEVIHHGCGKAEMLKKGIMNKNETQSENFINLGASLQKHHALVTLKDKGRGNGVTYLTHKKRCLELHEPPLIKNCTDIKQFVKQPLHLNYPNHMQFVERAVKMTTAASGRTAGSNRQIGVALCTIAGKKAMDRQKNTSQEKLLMLVNKIKAIIAVCIALVVCFQ